MIILKIVFFATFLSLQLAFAPAAGAISVADFKNLSPDDQSEKLARLTKKEIDAKQKEDSAVGQCLLNQFSTVSTNTLGAPDGKLWFCRK